MNLLFQQCKLWVVGSSKSNQDMKNIIILFFVLLFSGSVVAQEKQTLTVKEFRKASRKKDAVILDVRTPEEFAEGHIKNAVNIDWKNPEEFKNKATQLPKDSPIYVYCRSGVRSEQASNWLRTNGFTEVKDLKEGIQAWKSSGKKVSKE